MEPKVSVTNNEQVSLDAGISQAQEVHELGRTVHEVTTEPITQPSRQVLPEAINEPRKQVLEAVHPEASNRQIYVHHEASVDPSRQVCVEVDGEAIPNPSRQMHPETATELRKQKYEVPVHPGANIEPQAHENTGEPGKQEEFVHPAPSAQPGNLEETMLQSCTHEGQPLEFSVFNASTIEPLQSYITNECSACLTKHDELITALEVSISELPSTKKYIPLLEYERVTKEKEVFNSKLEERLRQRKEFDDATQALLVSLSELSTTYIDASHYDMVQTIQTKFARECSRLRVALPIYARRSDVIKTILSHQVTILVGETGSGKSTQVVQYLYDAGVANDGLIVCTQPRKVAAISLARHICKEMQIEVGSDIGFRVGMSVKCTEQTKVIFMTDHALLNECIADRSLSKYACILIDEAHERSINTDMLLAFIKQCLPSRQNLKLVIMSATIEPELFVRYYEQSTTSVSTIMVSGRTFPVEVEYEVNGTPLDPDNGYEKKAVEMVKKIHSTEPTGDILVFLTCPPEIEKACKALQYLHETAVVLPLHGKLSPEEQQKVFEGCGNKRKVILSTNIAETSVTIPGVKYVVDTGLAKEMQFDSRKNMDSLEIQPISRSSAEQRKGRAGRMSAGKCYRLYSEDDYSRMYQRMKPEIIRIQLSQVVLKLYEFGVQNVLHFDFVEHPDRVALEAAVETLKFVGAIKDDALTPIGKKMALLPLNPQLAKILLDGLQLGIGTETLCAVALSSLSGQVFFRGGTDEMKREGETSKLLFCHKMGAQMTSLLVYQHWLAQEKGQRNKWCVENFVNAKSMRIVEETVKEIGHILQHRLHVKVDLTLQSLEAAEAYLCKLYFDAFLNNLAVYLGHERIGYMTMIENAGTFEIFPGSPLKQLSSTPQYVIYEKILKTSRQFLTQVMCVEKEWVDEAIQSGRLAQDPADRFKAYRVVPLDVINVGPCTFREAISKPGPITWAAELEKAKSPQSPVSPILDFTSTPKSWGIIRVFAPESDRNFVENFVGQCINKTREDLKKVNKEFSISEKSDSVRVVIGAGGTVQKVIMPNQYRTLCAISPQCGQWVEGIEPELRKYGEIESIKPKQCRKDYRLIITYSDPVSASTAVSECKYPNVVLKSSQQTKQFTIRIQWQRRERKNSAFLNFESPEDCQNAIVALGKNINANGYRIFVNPDKQNPCAIFLSGTRNCLCTMNDNVLRDSIVSVLGNEVKFKVKMVFVKAFEETDESYQLQKRSLEDILAKYLGPETHQLSFNKPNPSTVLYQAFVNFSNPEEGERVLNSGLSGETIHGKPLIVVPHVSCVLMFKQEVYDVIKESLTEYQKRLECQYPQRQLWIRHKVSSPLVAITITSDDIKVLSVAKNAVDTAARPLLIDCRDEELHEFIISHTFHEQMDAIQSSTSTCTHRDLKMMCIKIYGTLENKMKADGQVREAAKDLFSGGARMEQVELGSRNSLPGLMKHLIIRYGKDLNGMHDFEGVRRVSLNPRRQVISLLATSEGLEAVKKCIEEYSPPGGDDEREFNVECSACFTSIDDPKELIRLEPCGHAYHIECIEMQLKFDTLTLPIQCAGEDCSRCFLLADFENIERRSKFETKTLVSASLKDYLARNGDKHRNCPTPDCKMIYAKTDDGQEFICIDCEVSTCTKCDQSHPGITCKMNESAKCADKEFEEWMKENPGNRKLCPKCSTPIEKSGGCNHMICTHCKSNMCWVCLKLFDNAQECYKHLHNDGCGMYSHQREPIELYF